MAKQKITFTLTLNYDPDEHGGMQPRNFLYHFLNRFNNTEVEIAEVEYKGVKFDTQKKELKNMPLRKVDSLDFTDLPLSSPDDYTKLAPEINENIVRRKKEGKEIIRT